MEGSDGDVPQWPCIVLILAKHNPDALRKCMADVVPLSLLDSLHCFPSAFPFKGRNRATNVQQAVMWLLSPAPCPCLKVMLLSGYLLLDLFIATIPCVYCFFTLFLNFLLLYCDFVK